MIDIVTINLNNREGLERTVESVTSQTFFDKINYIIIDGGSTDGSKEVIESVKNHLFFSCSEEDKGIFNAFNKGIDHLSGDYVLFLNSGDYLLDNKVIERVYDKLDADIVYGNEVFYKHNNAMVSYTKNNIVITDKCKYPDELNEDFFKRSALPHQSTFVRVDLHKKYKYDENCIICGDWKFLRECIMERGATYKHIEDFISCYNIEGLSAKNFKTFLDEKDKYYKKLLTNER